MDTLGLYKLIRHCCFMASLDLINAYYAVTIAKQHQRFLKFRFNSKLYQFTSLPNGLSLAPTLFTKRLNPLLCSPHANENTCISYLNDLYMQVSSLSDCRKTITAASELLTK